MTVRMRKHSQLGEREADHQRRSDGGATQPASVQLRICADVQLRGASEEAEARRTIKRFCAERLDAFKIPVKIRFVQDGLHSDRLKRLRIGRDAVKGPADI